VEIVGEAEESGAAFAGINRGVADLVVTELHLCDGTCMEYWGCSRKGCRR
jgi:hypothetical protein